MRRLAHDVVEFFRRVLAHGRTRSVGTISMEPHVVSVHVDSVDRCHCCALGLALDGFNFQIHFYALRRAEIREWIAPRLFAPTSR
jgi:hypothetical protein